MLSLWLLRVLLFRLLFGSGAVKLLSGDESWRFPALSALRFHLFTQPLPNRLGLWLHAGTQEAGGGQDLAGEDQRQGSPPSSLRCRGFVFFLRASTAIAVALETAVPPLFFLFAAWPMGAICGQPSHARRCCLLRSMVVGAMALLQMGIACTGNFGFFNALTVALLAAIPSPLPSSCSLFSSSSSSSLLSLPSPASFQWWLEWLHALWFVPLALAQYAALASTLEVRISLPRGGRGGGDKSSKQGSLLSSFWSSRSSSADHLPWLWRVLFPSDPSHPIRRAAKGSQQVLATLYVGSHYGVFANMTKRRPSLVLEGCRAHNHRRRADKDRADGDADDCCCSWEEIPWRFQPSQGLSEPSSSSSSSSSSAFRRYTPPPLSLWGHLPRFDWRLWFVALQAERRLHGAPPEWLQRVLASLLLHQEKEGEEEEESGTNNSEKGARRQEEEEQLRSLFARSSAATAGSSQPITALRIVLYDFHWRRASSGCGPSFAWHRSNRRLYFGPVKVAGGASSGSSVAERLLVPVMAPLQQQGEGAGGEKREEGEEVGAGAGAGAAASRRLSLAAALKRRRQNKS